MSTKTLSTAMLLAFLAFVFSAECLAAIYKYTDKSGTLTFVDRLEKVPPEYRDRVTVIESHPAKQEPPGHAPQMKPGAAIDNAPAPVVIMEREKPGEPAQTPLTGVLMRALGAAALIIALLIAFSRLSLLAEYRKLGRLICAGLSMLVLLYLVGTQTARVAAVYRQLTGQVAGVQGNLAEKGQEAERLVKELEKEGAAPNGVSSSSPAFRTAENPAPAPPEEAGRSK